MLSDILEVFNNELTKTNYKILEDNYTLKKGKYVIVSPNGEYKAYIYEIYGNTLSTFSHSLFSITLNL